MTSTREELETVLKTIGKAIAMVTGWIKDEGEHRQPDWKDEHLVTVKSTREQIEARLADKYPPSAH